MNPVRFHCLGNILVAPARAGNIAAMSTPLRFDMILPNGKPLKWNTPGARWGGTVEEVMAALAQENQNMSTPYNRISVEITDQMVTDILGHITAIRGILSFGVNLTDKERQALQKLGDATIGFANKAAGYRTSNPEFNSVLFPTSETGKDRGGRLQVEKFLPDLQSITRLAEDTHMILGSEELRACTAYMNNAGEAAARGLTAAEPIYKDLAESYPGPGARTAAAKAKTPSQ